MADKSSEEKAYLPWEDIEPHTKRWHRESLEYLSTIWPSISTRRASPDTWGDEVECQILRFDHKNREVHLSLKQEELLKRLNENAPPGVYSPEFARYMIETSPANPHNSSLSSLLAVEPSLKSRRAAINSHLPDTERLMTLSIFPLLGTTPLPAEANPAHPLDAAIADGPYALATHNMRARSARPPSIALGTFRDAHTSLPPTLRLAHVLFGPGACGLQATFQCGSLADARALHDHLAVLGPVFLALTAATPIYAGVLVDSDCRWRATSAAVDDRREAERAALHARWSASPMFLAPGLAMAERGVEGPVERRSRADAAFLEERGVDEAMARYFALLHLRDPLYLAATAASCDEVRPEDVHASVCASVWSHVRLKVPGAREEGEGWRVEFRPMEVQLTDFANAAFLIFLDLVRQVLGGWGGKLDLWMPMGMVKENMERAQRRDAVTEERLWFTGNALRRDDSQLPNGTASHIRRPEPVQMTIREIVNGSQEHSWPGLLPLVDQYFTKTGRRDVLQRLDHYLCFIRRRATGEARTPARWMRDVVRNHKAYRGDSVVSPEICYDVLREVAEISS